MNRLRKIYEILSKHSRYYTSKEISEMIDLSDKTIRMEIKELKKYLKKYDIILDSKKGKGYILTGEILSVNVLFPENIYNIPNNSEERQDYILDKLINEDYIKKEDISSQVYTSVRTISNDVNELRKKLYKFDLCLKSKPYYGIYISGSEHNLRKFLIKYREEKLSNNLFSYTFPEKFNSISSYVQKYANKNNMKFSDIDFANIIIVIYTTFERLEKGKYIEEINSIDFKNSENIKNIIIDIRNKYYPSVIITKEEIIYITVHFYSKGTLLKNIKSKEIDDLIKKIIKYIKLTYRLSLDKKEELYNTLYKHLIPLAIRIKFNINLTNPLLLDIKKNMNFAYNVALYMANIINQNYGSKISEDEIGYLAVIIGMCVDFEKKEGNKKNILVICPMGRATSKFLKYGFLKYFEKYINNIQTCSIYDLENINLENYDLVFSVVDFESNKKIYKISYFFNEEDVEYINSIFEEKTSYDDFLSKQLFIYLEDKKDKNEIIKILSNKIKEETGTKYDIYEQVLEREKLGYTEIVNSIAIPHPMSKGYGFNKVAVAVLKESIVWEKSEVNLIFLICIDNMSSDVENFYSKISKFFYNQNKIKELLKLPTFDKFIEIIDGEKS